MILSLMAVLALLSAKPPDSGITPESSSDSGPAPLEYQPWRDGILTGAAGSWYLLSELALKRTLAPASCHWCEPNAVDTWARGARWALGDQGAADVVSGVVAFAI